MLNAMFKEIQSILGNEYGLFSEFDAHVSKSKETLAKYKNIGVLYVNNGNLGKLPDGAMMEINYMLELFMRVDDSVNLGDVVVDAVNKLAAETTGEIKTKEGNAGQFFINTGLPSSDGIIVEGAGDFNYIRYELPISVTFVNGIALSDNSKIVITIDGMNQNKPYPPLQSVLSFTEAPQTQLETMTFVNDDKSVNPPRKAMDNENMIVSTSWNAQVNKLFRPYDKVDQDLRKLALDTPYAQATVEYDNGSEPSARKHRVIIHDVVFANELGQPAYLSFKMSTSMR